jgi:hypothetical protein
MKANIGMTNAAVLPEPGRRDENRELGKEEVQD